MILELKEDSPLYGKKGTIVNESILKIIPPKHHSLFVEHVRKRESKTYEHTPKPMDIGDLERYLNDFRNRPQRINNPFEYAVRGILPVDANVPQDPAEPAEEFNNFNPFMWGGEDDEELEEDYWDEDEEE